MCSEMEWVLRDFAPGALPKSTFNFNWRVVVVFSRSLKRYSSAWLDLSFSSLLLMQNSSNYFVLAYTWYCCSHCNRNLKVWVNCLGVFNRSPVWILHLHKKKVNYCHFKWLYAWISVSLLVSVPQKVNFKSHISLGKFIKRD